MTIRFYGQRLKQALKECQLTQADVARELNVSRHQVSNWCREKTIPPFLVIMEIMELTHKDTDYFFGLPVCAKNSKKLRKSLKRIYDALVPCKSK